MIRKALFWSFGAQLVSLCVLFGGSVVIARLLSPRELGIYGVSLATIGILQIVAAFGVGNYIVRATEVDADTMDAAFTVNAVLGLGLGAAIYAASFLGARFLDEPAVASVMRLLALTPVIDIFGFRPSCMMQREMRFGRISIISTTQAVITTGVTILAAVTGASSLSPACGAVASSLVGAIAYNLMDRRHITIRVSRTGWRPIATFGLRMMSIGGVSALSARVSDIIVGHGLGLAALGLFGRANNLSMLIFTNVYGTATRVIFAKLAADYRTTGELRGTYLHGLRLITGIMGPLLIGLAVLAQPVVLLLYGPKWLDAALPLSLLMVAQFITLRYAMNWELFVIKDELRVQTRIEFARALFGLVSRFVASLFSIVAVALAAIADGIFAIAMYGGHMNRLIDVRERQMMRISGEAVLLAGAAALPAFGLMMWTGWDPHTPLWLVVTSIVAGVLLWIVALVTQRHPLLDEFWRAIAVIAGRFGGGPVQTAPTAKGLD